MSDNINFNYKNLSPFKWFVLENFPFIEADFDALTEWQLFCKIGKEINKIIDSQNIVGEQAETLTNAFNNLKNYVDNYFENLDVQEEINNKLNEMVTDGTLQEIISSYLNSKAIFGFDNVEEMKNSTNLIDGSFAKTLGFYSKNDGGGALYKIRNISNSDVVDEMFIISLNNSNTLIAELIIENEIVNVKTIGVKSIDTTNNNSQILNNAIALEKYTNFFIPKDKYYFNQSISLLPRVNIKGDFDYDYLLDYSENKIYFNNSDGFINCDKNIIEGLCLNGNTNNTAIKRTNSGNGSMILKCCIFNFNIGIYGDNKSFTVENCIIANCNLGISKITDSLITLNTIKTCNTAISLIDCGDNRIINNRIEWNEEFGIYIERGWHNMISNNLLDRNGYNAIKIQNCPNSYINSNLFRRNYAKGNNQNDSSFAHIYISYCENLNVSNNMTDKNHIIDGDSSSNIEPAHSLYMIGSHYINLIGNDFTGCRERNIVYDPYQKRVMIEDVINSIDNTSYNITAGNSQLYELNLPFIPDTGTPTLAIKLYISYRAGNNSFYKFYEKNIAFMNDNGNILSESFSQNDDNVEIVSQGISNNKLKINVTNNNNTGVRVCISHKMILLPYNSSYTQNNYSI